LEVFFTNVTAFAPSIIVHSHSHGSNGKVMTAWALMRLVQAGKVELDAPVNRYLKRWQVRSTKFDPKGASRPDVSSTRPLA